MMLQMNISKCLKMVFSVIILMFFLWACGTSPVASNTSPTINLTYANSTAQSAASTLFAQTMTAIPTSTGISTDTVIASTPPTPTLLPFKTLDGLRVAYIIDGNLYVQDSGKPAIQLTHTGQDSDPRFTDDGQKIIFYRASESQKKQLYNINSDGTEERTLVISDLLPTLGFGYDEITELDSPIIIPGTHQILFNTQQLNSLKLSGTPSTPNGDLLLADMDTGVIKQLLAIGQGGNFLVSPDGKLVAVQTPNEIEVITTQGQVVHRIPFTYPEHDIYGIAVPMAWTQDSRELIVAPPIPVSELPHNQSFPVLRTVWRYSLDGGSGIEIRLNPPPVGEWFMISPDGNWVAYSYQLGYPASADWNPGKPVGIYLGNLHDGTSKLLYTPPLNDFDVPSFYHSWSPDSTQFIVEDTRTRTYIGNIHGEMTLLAHRLFAGWIDSNHYLLSWGVLELVLGEVGKQEFIPVMETPSGLTIYDSRTYIFIRH